MRSRILAFVLGAWLLQQQAALPDLRWLVLLPPLFLPIWLLRQQPNAFTIFFRHACVLVFCAGAGFFWAAGTERLGGTLGSKESL